MVYSVGGDPLTKEKTKKEDITVRHELIPEHILLNKEQKEEVLKRLGVTEEQLPKIRKRDPALKLFNIKAKIGDVILIKRKDPTGEYEYYRVVV